MAWRMKSLSEDNIDVYTHTWTVVFFLLISFLVLVIPQSSINQENSTTQTVNLPKYEASCWCPAQFESSQVAYTNGVCGSAFNAWIEGREFLPARIYYMTPRGILVPPDKNTDQNNETVSSEKAKASIDQGRTTKKTQSVAGALFLLAICLRIPYMLWSILSGCTSFINMDQTLQAAKLVDSVDAECQQQMYSRIIKAFSDSSKRRPNISTYVYILMKCMVIVVIVGEIVVVTQHSLVKTQEAGNNTLVETKTWYGTSVQLDLKFSPVDDPVFHCTYAIRQMTNIHEYVVQCLFKRQQSDSDSEIMLSSIHLMVISVLVVLAVFHVFSTASLLVNLCSESNRQRISLPRDTPLDLLFLIHLAQKNLSLSVASRITEFASVNAESVDGELELVKTL